MTVLAVVWLNDWLRPFWKGLRAAGKPPKLALIAAMRKLLRAVYGAARNCKPFIPITEQARAA